MTREEQANGLIKEWRRKAGFGGLAACSINLPVLEELIVVALAACEREVWEEAVKWAQEMATCYQRNGEYERAAALFEMRDECAYRRQRRGRHELRPTTDHTL